MGKKYIEARKIIEWCDQELRKNRIPDLRKSALQDVVQKVISERGADVAPVVRAYWQKSEVRSMWDGKGINLCYCSHCRSVGNGKDDYCRKCGAIMNAPLYEGCD